MPTNNKKTVSLVNEDFDRIKSLRRLVETEDKRFSQAEIIRIALKQSVQFPGQFIEIEKYY